MGHTWIKLREQAGNTLKKWSFGFWPGEKIDHPDRSIAGKVKTPDEEHESIAGEDRLDMAYAIDQKSYTLALEKAKERTKNPPAYKLTGYNCTKFAHDIATTAGISFPNTAVVMPFVGKVYSPNALYESIEQIKNKTVKDNPSVEPDTLPDLPKEDGVESEIHEQKPESNETEPVIIETLIPDPSKPISFLGLDQIELEPFYDPTKIEILDNTFFSGMEGWENVKVKNLSTNQTGYIQYKDIVDYLEI